MKTTILPLKHSMNRSPVRLALLLIPLALACFALGPQARADCRQGCDLTSNSTFLGDAALLNNSTGFSNTAIGLNALTSNTTGYDNVATGVDTLYSNTIGIWNTAIGDFALYSNTVGNYNTATGSGALENNTHGGGNTATGWGALGTNSIGGGNTAVGYDALYDNRRGSFNIALGNEAGMDVTGSNNIDIGSSGKRGESNTIRIGTVGTQTNAYISGISGVTVAGGVAVVIDANGQLGTSTSSARYKKDIKPMDKASEAILALKPVSFRYKHDLDPAGIPQFGLVAEEVEKVNPDLVARNEHGKPYTVRYEAVNAMLLNEFLKEHRKVEQQATKVQRLEAMVAEQNRVMQTLAATVKEQAALIQKVSDNLDQNQSRETLVAKNP